VGEVKKAGNWWPFYTLKIGVFWGGETRNGETLVERVIHPRDLERGSFTENAG
jgi:hypothetical protein